VGRQDARRSVNAINQKEEKEMFNIRALKVGETYKNKRGDRRKVVNVDGDYLEYEIIEKSGRGPGVVGDVCRVKVNTFLRWGWPVRHNFK